MIWAGFRRFDFWRTEFQNERICRSTLTQRFPGACRPPLRRRCIASCRKRYSVVSTVSGRLPTAVETTLYRIVQEALTNAVKHAKASNLWIRAWREDFTQCCTIRDDGAGFKVRSGQGLPRKGLGLVAMRERVSAIGGTLQIESRPGHGTEISIRLPLEGNDANTNHSRG